MAVTLFALGRAFGVDAGRDELNARQHYEVEKKSALAACDGADNASLRQCVVDALEAAQGKSESRQGLYAQQDMSKWAFWTMIASSLTMSITLLGLVWIRGTLLATRDAVVQGQRAADAAFDMLKSDRAWLLNDESAIVIEPNKAGTHINIRSVFRNFGRSPAINVRSAWQFRVVPSVDEFSPDIEALRKIAAAQHPVTVAPNGPNIREDAVRNDIFLSLTHGDNFYYAVGYFTYNDIFVSSVQRETLIVQKFEFSDDGTGEGYSVNISTSDGSNVT